MCGAGCGNQSPGPDPAAGRPVIDLPSALAHLPEILRRLDQRPAVFLDFDGTLAPIVSRPQDARLPTESRGQLERLAARVPVGILSGRALDDVRRRVGLEGLYLAGSHGFEIAGADGARDDHPGAAALVPVLDCTERELREQLGALPGVILERKRFSLAAHVRLAGAADAAAVARAVAEALDRHPQLRCTPGRKVYDLQPALDWHKGRALQRLLAEVEGIAGSPRVPLYIGDDVTDEDAFRVLRNVGVAIIVRGALQQSSAEYALDDPREVCHFLTAINESLEHGGVRR